LGTGKDFLIGRGEEKALERRLGTRKNSVLFFYFLLSFLSFFILFILFYPFYTFFFFLFLFKVSSKRDKRKKKKKEQIEGRGQVNQNGNRLFIRI
jgi:1,4-dihydroxy-2-naphthoate octaprenyltransferase